MKRVLFGLVAVPLFVSCAATKKTTGNAHLSADECLEAEDEREAYVERFVDTTAFENDKVTITEIDFFDACTTDAPAALSRRDNPMRNVSLQYIGELSGVKKIRQTTIERDRVKKGESGERGKIDKSARVSSSSHEEERVLFAEKSEVEQSKRCIYLFIAIAIAVAVVLLRNRLVPLFRNIAGYLKRGG